MANIYASVKQTGPIWALFCLLLLAGCDSPSEPLFLSGPTMGTSYNITIVQSPGSEYAQPLQDEIDSLLNNINQVASTYIDDSELMLFNTAPLASEIAVSKTLFELLTLSKAVYDLTEGAYDVTVGPVVNLWGFGPENTRTIPEVTALNRALDKVGFDKLTLNRTQQSALKSTDIEIDLSSVAKGYAVDKISDYLSDKGFTDFLVEVGGEMRVQGRNPKGDRWRIGIESPTVVPAQPAKALSVTDVGIATSGDYRNFFTVDGVRYSHTIDPRDGRPVSHNLASVTVIHPSSAQADALATGLTVLGEANARALCELQGLACFFIVYKQDEFQESYSSEFAQFLD